MGTKNILLFLLLTTHFNAYSSLEIPVYGSIGKLGYYYIKIFVGYPIKQTQTLVIDTGSSLTSFTCSDCIECGTHEFKPYNISLSNPCILKCNGNEDKNVINSDILKKCNCSREGKCIYNIKYSEGSELSGYFIEDFVEFENIYQVGLFDKFNQIFRTRLVIGCNLFERNLFKYQRATGIFGLGNFGTADRLNFVLNNLFNNNSLKNESKNIISVYLNTKGGKLSFEDDINGKLNDTDKFNLIQRCRNEERYCGYIQNIKFNGSEIITNKSGKIYLFKAVFDTGTTVTVLPSNIYNNLINEIFRVVIKLNPYITGHDYKDGTTCWKISNKISLDVFPNLKLLFIKSYRENEFEHSIVNWTPYSYLFISEIVDLESKIYCLGIVSDNNLGNSNTTYSEYQGTKNYQLEITLGATFFINRKISFHLREGHILVGDDVSTLDTTEDVKSYKYLYESPLGTKLKSGKIGPWNFVSEFIQKPNETEFKFSRNVIFWLRSILEYTCIFISVFTLLNPIINRLIS